ncbi:hypothetical protein CLAIMM_06194 [Cladophialophora immunda]|nr:hypothetical protein CLAIMM_06194 [Cladophialophora immunda]
MLTGEQSRVRDYWRYHGDKALEYPVRGIIMMGAHWDVRGRKVHVAANPNPKPEPIGLVKKSEWIHHKPNPDVQTAHRCVKLLRDAGFDAVADTEFNWLIDTFPMLIRMFPGGMPPVTIISLNSFFEPYFHLEIGRVLRPLRREGYLFIGSGGGVHNLYRTEWNLEDVLCKNGGGPALKRGVVRLMKHPNYRDAHGTDDHYMATCFVAGVVGEEEDRDDQVVLGAEVWELRNQAETQFCAGDWDVNRVSESI